MLSKIRVIEEVGKLSGGCVISVISSKRAKEPVGHFHA